MAEEFFYLDIIIPSYNDMIGLRQSLNSLGQSISLQKVLISVIDDNSSITIEEYQKLIDDYPWLKINFYKLYENVGPGMVRTFGIQTTCAPFILMLDCGDLFYSTQTIDIIMEALETNPQIEFFNTQILQEINFIGIDPNTVPFSQRYIKEFNVCFYGKIISRELYEQFKMPTRNSYCHEDIPYIMLCMGYAIRDQKYMEIDREHFISVIRTINPNSMTHQAHYLDGALDGYIDNLKDILENNNLDDELARYLIARSLLSFMNMILTASAEDYKQMCNPKSLSYLYQFYQEYVKPHYQWLIQDYDLIIEYYNCVRAVINDLTMKRELPIVNLDLRSFCDCLDNQYLEKIVYWPKESTNN